MVKKHSVWKTITLLVLVLSLLTLCGCSGDAGTTDGGDETQTPSGDGEGGTEDGGASAGGENTPIAADWDEETLLAADFLLYNVNCGGAGTTLPEGETCGIYQSVADQPYGEDAGTGKSWGYTPVTGLVEDEASTGTGMTAYRLAFDQEADVETPEILYTFQLPAGEYDVTVGFYDPPGVRTVDVDCEGEALELDTRLLRYKLAEVQGTVVCEDGELNVRVYNSDAKNFMDWPIVSYIRVSVKPEYTAELLTTALSAYFAGDGEGVYTTASWEAYKEAYETAEKLSQESSPSETGLKDSLTALRSAYQGLVLKYRYDSFSPGEVWRDTENNIIQAHGGQVQQLEVPDSVTGQLVTKWVWVGEDKSLGYRGGVRAYSSDDLYNWQFEGVIMRNVDTRESLDEDEYFQEVYAGYTAEELDRVYLCINSTTSVIERPKLLYNEKTQQYVLWFHADGPTETSDSNYAAACAGLAVSDSPFGPYRFVDRYRLNVCPPDQEDYYPESRGMARDMNLFKDTDGTAYIIYSSEENLTLYISKLNDEYTYLATPPEEAVYGVDYIRLFPGAQREAPALFYREGKYYLLTSGCTGWDPNQARYYVADSVLGEWTSLGDPCIGDDSHTTFRSQSTCVFQDPVSGTWIYMGDRWNSDDLANSRYVWLPIDFDEDGNMSFSFTDEWTLSR